MKEIFFGLALFIAGIGVGMLIMYITSGGNRNERD